MKEIPNSHLGNVNCAEDGILWLVQSFEWLRLTINVVDFEEEFDFVVWRLPGKLVHGVNKLLQADASVVIFVKDVKDSFHEKGLKKEI